MRTNSAAPESSLAADSRGGGINSGDDGRSLPHPIPAHIRQRLAAEGIRTCDDWLSLGERRFAIFGIPRRVAIQIDALVREASSP